MSPVHSRHPRRIPTARAYWELKAEQVMNRVFSPEPSIELEVIEEAKVTTPPPATAPLGRAPGLGLMAALLAGTTAATVGVWSHHQQALQQERNLLLVERIRTLAAAPEGAAANATAPATAAGSGGAGSDLPPPPPDEPWMQELAALPSSSAPQARVLQVPMSSSVQAAAPAALPSGGGGSGSSGGGSPPTLVGVIQIPGRSGSAIFDVSGSSTSAAVGESIGSSGWRLRSASGDSAVIERGGEQRRVSISSGF